MRKRTGSAALLTVAALLLGGCTSGRSSLDDLPGREYSGHYTPDRGQSWFHPCAGAASGESWWVTFTGRSVQQAAAFQAEGELVSGGRWFVRWVAAPTTEGQVGPGGPGATALLVREILEVRPATDEDCVP